MYRYLVAHLPQFRLERCGWDPHQAVILLAEEKNALRVQCASFRAQKAGIRPGMTGAEARALLPDLEQELVDPQAEEQDLEDLTLQLYRISPSIAGLPPNAIVAEIRRSAHLVGGERATLERTRLRLRQLGHHAQLAIADDIFSAHLCAEWGKGGLTLVPSGASAAALRPLPLQALGLDKQEHAFVAGLGINTVGAFADLPAASIVGRLSPTGVLSHQRARGQALHAPLPLHTDDQGLAVVHDLPDPVTDLEALVFVLGAMLRELGTQLTLRDSAATRLTLTFTLDNGDTQQLSMRLARPSRCANTLLSLLRRRLERTQLKSSLHQVRLDAPDLVPFHGTQHDLLRNAAQGNAVDDVIAQLRDALGAGSVIIPTQADRYRPEVEWQPKLSKQPSTFGHLDPGHRRPDGSDPVYAWQGRPLQQRPLRPALLITPPRVIDLDFRVDHHRPKRVVIDGVSSGIHHILGPEQLEGEWWDRPFVRSYWCLFLEDGRRAWIYQEDGLWMFQGWWDGGLPAQVQA